jgi:16S rRNA A1518/A1519 N6-dimethyltransferase RsmA/KsgA/DIM1 with predicted DNA glycosylase/AP lyase activity
MAIVEDPEGHEPAAVRALVPSFDDLRVLEVGAGDGRLTALYAHEAAAIIAIDPDGDAIDDLRAALPHVDARAIGIADLVLPDRSVDAVIFSWSL